MKTENTLYLTEEQFYMMIGKRRGEVSDSDLQRFGDLVKKRLGEAVRDIQIEVKKATRGLHGGTSYRKTGTVR